MRSPFPGVDPYLEDQNWWPDFHAKFINAWQDLLLEQLPANYDARLGENVYVVFPVDEEARGLVPDLSVDVGDGDYSKVQSEPQGIFAGATTATLTLPPPYEVTEHFIQIVRHPDRSLVAVLELLSPTNKGANYSDYLAKRIALLKTSVHLVEVDLLFKGRRLPMIQRLPPGQFHAFISRGDERPKSTVASWTIRQPLPRIPIPLLGPKEHLVSNLQDVFDTAWKRGQYQRAVDYDKPLELPLSDADRRWLGEQFAKPSPSK